MTIYDFQDRDNAYNEVQKVSLNDGQKATITVTPRGRTSEFFLRDCAISKYSGSLYTVELDGRKVYDQEPIPPTDPDDSTDTFTPPKKFETEAVIVIKNASGTSHDYIVQLAGWERRRYSDESEEVPW